jgi:hypothetical protein
MQVHLDVPEDVARRFAAEPGGITRAAIEALAVEGVRSGKLTVRQAREMLGIRSRYEMDGVLKARGVTLPLTLEQVVADSETAAAFSK